MWKLIVIDDQENISYLYIRSDECMKNVRDALLSGGLMVKTSSEIG